MRSRDDEETDPQQPAFKSAAIAVAVAGLVSFAEVFAARMAERLFPERKSDK